MSRHTITKGLDLPIAGEPEQRVEAAPPVGKVAVVADDYVGMKPTMHVSDGDEVLRGQLLFEDKKTPGVRFTSPAAGRVAAVNRGDRRALQSVVIEIGENDSEGAAATFDAFTGKPPAELGAAQVQALLLESGLWTALRRRPFGRAAIPDSSPAAIFVTAIDTNPLAPRPEVVLEGRDDDFVRGVEALARLAPVHVCKAPGSPIPAPAGAESHEFEGPHPAGTPGVHIHFILPVNRKRTVWHVGYQDVAAIGVLFATGRLDLARVVSLAGPPALRPRLLRTRLGASLDALVQNELEEGEQRVISGSVFSGRAAEGEIFGYLGRFDNQISVLSEGREREVLGWMAPGFTKFSVTRAFTSALLKGQKFRFTTATNGSDRAMVPIGLYEEVMPMDILPTFLLRALLMQDVEKAEELGVLELDEEDVALCSFVCPGKSEYGPLLRRLLTTIEKEG